MVKADRRLCRSAAFTSELGLWLGIRLELGLGDVKMIKLQLNYSVNVKHSHAKFER